MTTEAQERIPNETRLSLVVDARSLRIRLSQSGTLMDYEKDAAIAQFGVNAWTAGRGTLEADNLELNREVEKLSGQLAALKEAIRNHRSKTGNDLCWENDLELWAVLNDGVAEYPHRTLPCREEFLANCGKYYESRLEQIEGTTV